jgi:hypothetical protein
VCAPDARGHAPKGCTCAAPPALPGALPLAQRLCFAEFQGSSGPVPDDLRARMEGRSWRAGCPVGPDGLVLLRLAYWDLAGERREGRLVAAADAAKPLLKAFKALYDARFPVERMDPVDEFDGDDLRSMEADNTSAFNCRGVQERRGWSRHALGLAVDLNPRLNPQVWPARISPRSGAAWADRSDVRPGMAVQDGAAVRAFASAGWKWGGRWRSFKDWQHFSRDGR